jgi:hypothetical protein
MLIRSNLILIYKIKKKLQDLLNVINFDKNEFFFLKKNKIKKKFDNKKKNIFIEIDNTYYNLCYYNNLLNNQEFDKYNVIGIWTLSVLFTTKKIRFLETLLKFYNIIYSFFLKKKFYSLYRSIGVVEFLDIDGLTFFHKKNLFLKKKNELFSIKYKGITVGDLIYDTYIRFRSFPTLRIKDKFINLIYSKICNIYDKLEFYKTKYKPRFYLSSSTAYIHHGFPYRYFLKKKITVISGRVSNSYNKLMTPNDSYSYYDFQNYKRIFQKLKKQNKKIKLSRNNLLKRFLGKNQLKNDLTYMNEDPYSNSACRFFPENEFKQKKIKGVLFLMDFYDAPAVWGQNVFEDIYLWTTYSLMIIKKYKLPIAIKPHPNAKFFASDTENNVERLKKKYSSLVWLNPKTSNSIIFSNIEYGISSHGSILFELAYHKKKAISCGRHPAENFNFSINAKSKKNYKDLLINIGKIKKNTISRKDFYIFNYMHYLSDANFFNIKKKFVNFKRENFNKSFCLRKNIY